MRVLILFTSLAFAAMAPALVHADGTTPVPEVPGEDALFPPGDDGQFSVDLEKLSPEELDKLEYEFEGVLDYDGQDPEYDRAVLKPMNLALGVVYAIITLVGLIANGVVFFVIFAGKEISK